MHAERTLSSSREKGTSKHWKCEKMKGGKGAVSERRSRETRDSRLGVLLSSETYEIDAGNIGCHWSRKVDRERGKGERKKESKNKQRD